MDTPSRVRDPFEKARVAKPAIIFIDELDAVGRSRQGQISGGANDEREQLEKIMLGAPREIVLLPADRQRTAYTAAQLPARLPDPRDSPELVT